MTSLFAVYEVRLGPGACDVSTGPIFVEVPTKGRIFTIRREYAKEKGISADTVALWKPRDAIGSSMGPRKRIKSLLQDCNGDLGKFCIELVDWESETISERFPPPTHARGTHTQILLAYIGPLPKPVENKSATVEGADKDDDVLSPLMKRLDLSKKKREFTPSAGAAPKHYRQIQDGDSPLLDRRYASRPTPVAAPIEIYHPVFAYFLGQCARDDIDPPPELVSHTMKFMYSVSEIATLENARAATTRKALTDLLEYAVGQDVNPDKTSADHSVTYTRRVIPIGNALLVVVEEKSELGQGGEGCVQGALSYHVYWAQSTGDLKTSCICPSFIISLAGPFMAICGAIWTSDVIVQHLTDYIWMGRSGNIEQDHVLRVARIFYALNRAIHRLAQYYANLEPSLCNDERQRFFPLATSYLDDNNKSVSFRYTAFLKEQDPSCLTFLATLEGNEKKVVVKFVERYGEKEHRLLASHGYAPQLLYYGNIWDETEHGSEEDEPFINPNAGCGSRRMVVMEYVEGEMLTDSSVPRSLVCKALYEVIGILHQDQSVHGDVRSPNILLTEVDDDDDEGDVKERIRVIDFDWAGQENTVRYPYGLSEEIRWPEGVREHAFILKEHDLKMIKAMEWVA